jgi:PAS domain S-box-containing protein
MNFKQSSSYPDPDTHRPYQAIICDDDHAYGEMLGEYLTIICGCDVSHVISASELWQIVTQKEFDILFLDYQLPGSSGLDILERMMTIDLGLPTVMMTGQGNEEIAVKAMQFGALDYLIKGSFDFNILPRIIEKGIHYRALRRDFRESQLRTQYQATILNNVQDAVVVWDSQGHITYWNQSAEKMFGTESTLMLGRRAAEVYFNLFEPPILSLTSSAQNDSRVERQLVRDDQVWVSSKLTRFTTQGDKGMVNHYMDVTRDITAAKQEHKALEQNQYMINRILEASPNIVFLFNLKQSQVTFIIPNQEPILSMAVERIFTQSSPSEIQIHPDDLPRIQTNLDNLANIADNRVYTIDFRIRTNENATWRWLLIREAVFNRDSSDSIEDIIGVCEDVTEQKQTEEKLELRLKSERFLSSISNDLFRISASIDEDEILAKALAEAADIINSCMGIIFIREDQTLVAKASSLSIEDIDWKKSSFNIDLSEEDYPWQSNYLLSHTQLIIPSIRALPVNSRRKLETLENQGINSVVIIPLIYLDGIYGVLLFGLKHWDPNIEYEHSYMLTTFRQVILKALIQSDIDRQLRLSESRYRAIVDEHQTEMICRFTTDFALTFANTAFYRYYKISRDDALQTTFLQPISENDVDRIRESIAETQQNSDVILLDFKVHQAAQEKWQEWIIRPIINESQVLIEYQAVGRDITERKEMENQINTAHTRLAQANRLLSIGQLATSMAHLINNPLTTIIADAQILSIDIPKDDPKRESVNAIVSAGWRVQQIVDELLKFSSHDETRQEVKIRESIEKAMLLSSSQVLGELENLTINVPEHLAIFANLRQLEDLWLNLLLGILQKRNEKQQSDVSITIEAEENSEGLVVSFICTNFELTEEEGAEFFEPDLVPTSSKWSTGMELSICREIIRQNNGTVKLYPRGKDTIIDISLFGESEPNDRKHPHN